MTSYSSTFNEIIKDNKINSAFFEFFDAEAGKLLNSYMPPEVVVNSEDIAILKAQVANQYAQITTLTNYIAELKIFIGAFKSAVYIESSTPGVELDYSYLL
jgi:hypothetical protein